MIENNESTQNNILHLLLHRDYGICILHTVIKIIIANQTNLAVCVFLRSMVVRLINSHMIDVFWKENIIYRRNTTVIWTLDRRGHEIEKTNYRVKATKA